MPATQVTTSTPSVSTLPASMHLASMAVCIAASGHSPADYIEWRDIFCSDCGDNECMKGTAQELAEHVVSLNWIVKDVKTFDVMCPNCVEVHG